MTGANRERDPTSIVADGRPSPSEMAARHARFESLLAASGVRAVVVYGNVASPHDVSYLTGWPPGWDTYLVMVPGERPRLYVPSPNHVPAALELAGPYVDVEWSGPDASRTVAAAIAVMAGGSGSEPIGVVGPIPYQARDSLAAAVGRRELVDLSARMLDLRLIKSSDEIDRARSAARLVDAAIETLVREARPGLRDFELGAIVEHAYRRLGGAHGICFLSSAPMTGGGRTVPAQVWSDRMVERGDMILVELSVYLWGASSQALRTITLGDPPERLRELHGIADRAFGAIEAAIQPGVPATELLDVAGLIDRADATVIDDVVHGYGGGYLPPVLRTPATQVRPVPDLILRPGMLLVVQPNVVAADRRLGVQTGELLAVTEGGPGRLHGLRRGLLLADAVR